MSLESPYDAVQRVLTKHTGAGTSFVIARDIAEAVRRALPVPVCTTIRSLRVVLRSLSEDSALDFWADRSAHKIVEHLSKTCEFQRVLDAGGVDDEAFWCQLEGTIAGLLLRVARGEDLDA